MDRPYLIEEALYELTDYPKDSSDRYYNDEGFPIPRVTEILSSMIHSDALMYWANNLGFRNIKYKTALTKASDIGTRAHNAVERYLEGKATEEDYENVSLQAFQAWQNTLIREGHKFKVLSMEQKITCRWFGGTYDLLVSINGKTYLVDLKTGNHVTEKYFLQLAAYRYMLAMRGIHVNGVIVLQLSKETDSFNEYVLDFNNPAHLKFIEDCTRTFLSLVYAYYNLDSVRKQYRALF